MRTDGRTDITKLVVAFRSFAKAPENFQNTKIISKFLNIIYIKYNILNFIIT